MSTTPSGDPAPRAYEPKGDDVVKFLQQNAVFGQTRRMRQLDRYEAHWKGTQYDHQEFDWWGRPASATETVSPDVVVPDGFRQVAPRDDMEVREMRPTAPRNLCKSIVRRFTGLLLSNKRRPRVTVENDDDTGAFLEAVRESSHFWSVLRAGRNLGGAVGSVCFTVHLRDGEFSYEAHNTKHLQVIWKDRAKWRPLGILKMYEYPAEEDVRGKDGKVVGTREVSMLYRRIITDTVDVTYKPVKLEDGAEVSWEEDPAQTVRHGLGFFPGVWVQNTSDSEDMDGDPDCAGAWQQFDTGDRLLSQMNKGGVLNLDPTLVLGYDPKEVAQAGGVQKGSDHALNVGKSGKAAYLELEGTSIEVGLKLLALLRQDALDLARCVILDPDQISGSARSGKAIEYIYAPMLEAADDLRDQYGPAIVDLSKLTERMARKVTADLGGAKLRDDEDGTEVVAEVEFVLPPRKVQDADGKVTTKPHALGAGGGYVQLEWGPYFAPSEDDNQAKIRNAAAANQARLVDVETAASYVAPIFSVLDVKGTVARAKQEAEENAALGLGGEGGGVLPGDDLGLGRERGAGEDGEPDGPGAGAGGKP